MKAQPHINTAEIAELLDCVDAPAIALSIDYRVLASNSRYRAIYGDLTRPGHSRCYEISHRYNVPCDQAGESCPLKASLESGQTQRVLHLHHTPRGREHVDVETRPVHDKQGEIIYFIEMLRQSKVASSRPAKEGLVGVSAAFTRMLELIERVAPRETAVLLQGESGTGKELVARAIHEASPRAKAAIIQVECSGLTETLFESELFGHEKGAFTGALTKKIGLVEAAQGGTLFLDEVGDIPLNLQVKLLRLLETRTFRRVGSTETVQADFRLVCASHRDLREMVAAGAFREDLFYRINAFPIHAPALRECTADLPLLVESLLRRVEPARSLKLHREALAILERYSFPGNIRELRNILEFASVMADDGTILPRHLPHYLMGKVEPPLSPPTESEAILPLEEVERQYLQRVLATFSGEKKQLAQLLGVSERTLYRKLQGLREESR